MQVFAKLWTTQKIVCLRKTYHIYLHFFFCTIDQQIYPKKQQRVQPATSIHATAIVIRPQSQGFCPFTPELSAGLMDKHETSCRLSA